MYFCTTKEFRDYLFELLKEYIGSATLAGGAVVPAVFVGEPPVDTRVVGLELSIPKDTSGNSQILTGGVAPTNKFEFRLIQHPSYGLNSTKPVASDYLSKAKDAIVNHMTPVDYRFLPAVRLPGGGEEQITLDQYVFTLTRSAMVLRPNARVC